MRNVILCVPWAAVLLHSTLAFAEQGAPPASLLEEFSKTPLSPTMLPSTPLTQADIVATLSPSGDKISGTVTYTFVNNTGVSLHRIPLWLYPNRFRKPSAGLDEGMLRWVYPRQRHKRGGVHLSAVRWMGNAIPKEDIHLNPLEVSGAAPLLEVIALVDLPLELAPGKEGHLAVSFEVTIPVRRGRFGRWGGVVSLGGGWVPFPMTDLTGQKTELPPERMDVTARIFLPEKMGAVLHDSVFPIEKKARQIEVTHAICDSLVLVAMDRMEISRRAYDWGEALHVHQEIERKNPSWKDEGRDVHGVPDSLSEPGRISYSSRLLDVVGLTADVIREVAPDAKLAKKIVLVDIPAWDRMVQPGYGPVLVSDRLWRLIPVRDGLFFHDLALVRAVAPTLLMEETLVRTAPLRRALAADLVGVFMADRYSKIIHKRMRSIDDIVGFTRIFPTIDNLLYAPQIPFREVYFKFYEEPEPLRDEPWMFMNRMPRGKRLLAKLKERGGETRLFEAVKEMLNTRIAFEETAEKILGENPASFLDTWTGPYPKLNYRLGTVRDVKLAQDRFRHEVEVIREGAMVREKVTVRFKDDNDVVEDLTWDKAEPRTVLTWISKAPLDEVEIDPAGVLVESAELTPDHPLRDNTNPLPWRPPMFTRLIVWGDLTSREPYIEIGFWLRRKYDNTNVFSLDLEYTPYTMGGVFSFLRFFGKKRTLNSRTWYLGPLVSARRYGELETQTLHLSSDIRQAATMGSAGVMFGRDTRIYGWDPMSGSSVSAVASYAAGASDDGAFRQMGKFSFRLGKLLSPGIHHTFALYGGASAVIGNPVASNLTSLSDRSMLRGFDSDETFGRVGMYTVLEYRHTLFDASRLTAPLYSWFDRFQGVLFLAGGTISNPSGPLDGIFTKERLFSEVGYGIRIHLLLLGVHQYLLCFDAAVPITPFERYVETEESDGDVVRYRRSPYKIIFGIIQTF